MNTANQLRLLPYDLSAIQAGAIPVTRDGRLVKEWEYKGDAILFKTFSGLEAHVWANTGARERNTNIECREDIFILDTAPVWRSVKDNPPTDGVWVVHTYKGARAPEYGLYTRGKFFRDIGPESFPTTHWLPIPPLPIPIPKPDFKRDFLDKQKDNEAFNAIWEVITDNAKEVFQDHWLAQQKKGGQEG